MLRRHVLALLVLLAPGFVLADPSDLAGGVLVAHHPPGLLYTSGQDWCARYFQEFAIDSCSEQNNRIDLDGNEGEESVWFVLAAWDEEKEWCGAEFGFAEYDSTIYLFDQWGPCFPSDGLEIPMVGWPGPNRGTALTTQDESWAGNFVPIYWLSGYAYEEGEIPLAANPSSEFGGTANCETPPVAFAAAAFGGMGLFQDGTSACPEGLSELDEGMQPDGAGGYSGYESEDPGQSQLTFVQFSSASESTFVAGYRALKTAYGLRVLTALAPDGLICLANEAQRAALRNDARVTLATSDSIPGLPPVTSDDMEAGEPGFAARAWNAVLESPSSPEPDSLGSGGDFPPCLLYDEEGNSLPTNNPLSQTSIYMMGEVGVSIIFMESDAFGDCDDPGLPEDWSISERNLAFQQIEFGLRCLAGFTTDADLSFTVLAPRRLSTQHEPIQYSGGYLQWRYEAMAQLGYTGEYCSTLERRFANDQRAVNGTDWWIILYVLRDVCDEDHAFQDGTWSHATAYGPAAVLLYLNGETYGIEDLDKVAAHETCHLFGAPDEYDDVPDCYELWGYLRGRNGNAVNCTEHQAPCLMNHVGTLALCPFTLAHLGWRDSDLPADAVFDPVDHPLSSHSMPIGEGDGFAPGDVADIYDSNENWVKRIASSAWNMDQGRMMWDGIAFDGTACQPDDYTWKRNGGEPHLAALASDVEPPGILGAQLTDLGEVWQGHRFELSLLFEDEDTEAGRVRAIAAPNVAGPAEHRVVEDEFLLDTHGGAGPIARDFLLPLAAEGDWTMHLRVWDVGNGHWDAREIPFHWASGLPDEQTPLRRSAITSSRPNPALDWVTWDVDLATAGGSRLAVIGPDGRCVKSWESRAFPRGRSRVLWSGLDDHGRRVPAGRYYLQLTDATGQLTSRSATIVR